MSIQLAESEKNQKWLNTSVKSYQGIGGKKFQKIFYQIVTAVSHCWHKTLFKVIGVQLIRYFFLFQGILKLLSNDMLVL